MLSKKDKHTLTKEMLFEKYNGRCALCGTKLPERWCIWEIKPSKTFVTCDGNLIFGDESYENKLPACTSCNNTRSKMNKWDGSKISFEEFRMLLQSDFEFLKDNNYYKKALRYGLIQETGIEIVFYFERI